MQIDPVIAAALGVIAAVCVSFYLQLQVLEASWDSEGKTPVVQQR